MIGAISILRFRTNIKDPRDMFFIFASLAIGLAAGVHAYSIATIGAICFVTATLILAKTPFAHGPQFDALLRLNLKREEETVRALEPLIEPHLRVRLALRGRAILRLGEMKVP